MTPTTQETKKAISEADLKALAHRSGPCVTIQTPAYKPGDGTGTRRVQLRELAHEAVLRVRNLNLAKESPELIDSIERLVAVAGNYHGGRALLLFAAPGGFEAIYESRTLKHAATIVGSHFNLVPLLSETMAPNDFLVLGISKNRVRLLHYADGCCEELPLPASVPANLKADGEFDLPDHDLGNRSTAGPSLWTGRANTRTVRFGTGNDPEAHGAYMKHYLTRIDQGLKEVIKNKPLFLAGVKEELDEFRSLSKHPYILGEQCHGNSDRATPDQIAAHAAAGAVREYCASAKRAAEALTEQPNKILGDAARILRAAQEGRVRRLLIADQATIPANGAIDGGFDGEDLVNACTVETIRTGGEVYAVAGNTIPGAGAVAAFLRY